jgi:hypothetical protein
VGRAHLFEFHDLPWFPTVWRGLLTDFLSFFAWVFKPYAGVAPVLADALLGVGADRIVDLCSGAGKPVLSVVPALRESGVSGLEIVLTDKYPQVAAWAALGNQAGFKVSFESSPVDALDVPERLMGFRTLFTSFHHFAPSEARKILEDAAAKNQGIGIFEYTERTWWLWSLPVALIPLVVWVVTPFIRPFSWRRLLWTYLLPVVPAVALWDGFVSCLRSYSLDELRGLIEGVGNAHYRWKIGRVPSRGLSRVTYAIGLPGDRVE